MSDFRSWLSGIRGRKVRRFEPLARYDEGTNQDGPGSAPTLLIRGLTDQPLEGE